MTGAPHPQTMGAPVLRLVPRPPRPRRIETRIVVSSARMGQTFHYFGTNTEKFEEVFSAIGAVLEPKAGGGAP